jgi:hypothetical protein
MCALSELVHEVFSKPLNYILRVLVGWKDWLKHVINLTMENDERETLNQNHVFDAHGW